MSYAFDKLKYTNDKLKLEQSESIIERLRTEKENASEAGDFLRAADITDKISILEKEQDELKSSVQLWDSIDQDVLLELDSQNYVRAILLSEKHAYEQNKIRRFQEYAVEQYAFDFRNAQGLRVLMQDYILSKEEVAKIINESLPEYTCYRGLQYDINTGNHITLQDWIDNFLKSRL